MLCGSPAKSRRDSAARSIGAAESVAPTIRHDATVMRFILAPLLARTSRRLIPIVQDKRASRTPHGGVGVPVFRTLVSSLSNRRADCERSGSSTRVGIAGAVRFDRWRHQVERRPLLTPVLQGYQRLHQAATGVLSQFAPTRWFQHPCILRTETSGLAGTSVQLPLAKQTRPAPSRDENGFSRLEECGPFLAGKWRRRFREALAYPCANPFARREDGP